MKLRALLITALLTVGLLTRGVSSQPGEKLPAPKRAPASDFSQVVSKFHFVGANSCSAAACHNGRPDEFRLTKDVGSEYTTWISKDAHARAYEVLFNEVSHRISKGLGRGPAHEDTLCLSCHVHPRFASASHSEWFQSDGVSCESCHGPAERWLTEHYRPEWQIKTAKEKLDLGMCDTRSVLGRTQMCVDCHVGSKDAEVNHDLIAAGHPRLNFEFGAFHANMPHHWPDVKDKNPDMGGAADFEARAWVVGQVATAKAAMELLATRASDTPPGTQYSVPGTEKRVWPEFAENDCFACHHHLAPTNWRQEPGRKLGALYFNRWYLAMTPQALNLAGRPDAEFSKLREDIRMLMEERRPDRAEIVRKAGLAVDRLQKWLDAPSLPEIIPATDWMARLSKEQVAPIWDEGAQFYLALAALHNAAHDMNDPTLSSDSRQKLQTLRRSLDFPKEHNSPLDFRPDSLRDVLRKLP